MSIIPKLIEMAINFYRFHKSEQLPIQMYNAYIATDPIMAKAQRLTTIFNFPGLKDLTFSELFFSDPEFSSLKTPDGELNPMLLSAFGGYRFDVETFLTSLFSSALLKQFYFSQTDDEESFVTNVIDGFSQLKSAIKGNKVKAYNIYGLAKIDIDENVRIQTPWGELIRCPEVEPIYMRYNLGRPKATCLFIEERFVSVVIDRAPEPKHVFDEEETQPSNVLQLLPVACAFSSDDTRKPAIPIVTWMTTLSPLQSGFSYSYTLLPFSPTQNQNISQKEDALQYWSRELNKSELKEIEISLKRLVTSVANRQDPCDSLIDAVMVWENLLGTKTEVTFRVTASLAKLIESDHEKRKDIQKRMKEIYDMRSRIVHGDDIEIEKTQKAVEDATDYAIQALQKSIKNGKEWLIMKSHERSDSLLLN